MIIIFLIGTVLIIGVMISFYYLSKALYFYMVYKKEKLFDKDYKEYKAFSRDIKNIYKKT